MLFICPGCGSPLQPQDIKYERGNGIHCGFCKEELRYSPPYHNILLFGSAPLMVAAVALWGVENGLIGVFKIILAWFFGSIALATLISWIKPPKLRLANDNDEDPYKPPSILS
jgi:hypothetical protein